MDGMRNGQESHESQRRSHSIRPSTVSQKTSDTTSAAEGPYRHHVYETHGTFATEAGLSLYRKPSTDSSCGDVGSPYSVVDCDLAKMATARMVTANDTVLSFDRSIGAARPSPSAVQSTSDRTLASSDSREAAAPTSSRDSAASQYRQVQDIDLSEDITSSLRLASPILPLPLETPTTPAGWYAAQFPAISSIRSIEVSEMPAPPESGLAEEGNGSRAVTPGDLPQLVPNRTADDYDNRGASPCFLTETYSDLEVVDQHAHVSPLRVTQKPLKPEVQVLYEPITDDQDSLAPQVSRDTSYQPNELEAQHHGSQGHRKVTIPCAAVICLAHILVAASFSQGLVPARKIGETLSGTKPSDLSWYTAAYALAAGISSVPAARLASVYGQQRFFTGGLLWLGLWSLLAGLAAYVEKSGGSGTAYFCFCRAMQGMGGAAIVPAGYTMLHSPVHPSNLKSILFKTPYLASAPLGFILGVVMSTLLAELSSWPWAFFSLATVCLASAVLGALVVLPTAPPHNQLRYPDSLWLRLDLPGNLLQMTALLLFGVGWNEASILSFHSPVTLFLIIVGGILFATFIYLETKAPYPLLPVKTFTPKTYLVVACAATQAASSGIWLWEMLHCLTNLLHWSPLQCSAALIPLAVSGITAAMITGYALGHKPAIAPWLVLVSATATLAGSAILAAAPLEQTYWRSPIFSAVLVPFGAAMGVPAAVCLLDDTTTRVYGHSDTSSGKAPEGLLFAVVMYALAMALGLAGTVEGGGDGHGNGDGLPGLRRAQYLGLGMGGLGVMLAGALVAVMHFWYRAVHRRHGQGR